MSDTDGPNDQRDQPHREIIFFPEKASTKELSKAPEVKRDRFINSLSLMEVGEDPVCEKKQLGSIDRDIYELCINGRPAWRCVIYTGESGKIVVLHTTAKTTNGSDRQIANVVTQRLKAWRSQQAGNG